jgi:oligopeptide transport system substrate-binding protein
VARPNRFYWAADKVRLQEVQFFTMASGEVEERSFRAGQLHVTYTLPTAKIPVWRERTVPEFRNEKQLAVYYYAFNVAHPPFNDVRVRRAFSMAVDRRLLVDRVTQGGEDPAWHFLPTGAHGYADAPRLIEDRDEARRLLAEAGFPGGNGFPTSTLLYNTLESHRQIAEALQQMWRQELGVDIRLQNQEWKVYLATRKTGDFQIARSGWAAAYNDVSVFAELMMADNGNNHTRWGNEGYDRLVLAAAGERDPVRRAALYRQADQVLLDELPVLPLYFYRKSYLLRPEVKGWYENLLDHHPLREVWLEPGVPDLEN